LTTSPSAHHFSPVRASSPIFFVLCGVIVAVWVAGLALGTNDRFVAASAGLMSAVTLMLVALLENAELRAEHPIQRKLDAIASALLEQQRGDRASSSPALEDTIGVHEQI
jgi:low affinity Fe/Cu permease